MSSGNGKIQTAITCVMTFVGIVLVGMLTTTNSTVKANEDVSVKEHTEIRKEIKHEDDNVRRELMAEIALLRREQRVMRKETNASFTKVLIAIERIKK